MGGSSEEGRERISARQKPEVLLCSEYGLQTCGGGGWERRVMGLSAGVSHSCSG